MTDRKPFEPIDGVTPRWRKLYDLVLGRTVGDEITYREALEVLDLDNTRRNRAVAQNAMRDAQRHLENHGERTVGTRVNFGWVVLDGQRELHQVDRRLVKTSRAAGRTLRGVKALGNRREELSQFERERLDQIGRSATLARQLTSRRNLDMDQLRKMIETK